MKHVRVTALFASSIRLRVPEVLVHDAAHGALGARGRQRHGGRSPGDRGAPRPAGDLVQREEARLKSDIVITL